jgi:hypothetical protein
VSKAPPGTRASVVTLIDMAADWASVYGAGYFAAHVLGNRLYARATLTGNMVTVLHVEFSNESNTRGNTKGVAADNKACARSAQSARTSCQETEMIKRERKSAESIRKDVHTL